VYNQAKCHEKNETQICPDYVLQDKALATKRPEMRDGRLTSKAKLKGGQIKDRVHKILIGDIT
jgi:hypothetical protein